MVDSRKIAKHLRSEWPEWHARLKHGVRYTRVMPEEDDATSPLGRSWRTTFNATERVEAEQQMAERGMRWSWNADGSLVTTTRCVPALRTDPRTGEEVFLNSLVAARLGWSDARNNASTAVEFADGTLVPGVLAEGLAGFMERERMEFTWQTGDLLMVDNRVAMHARNPFIGNRKVLALMRGEYVR